MAWLIETYTKAGGDDAHYKLLDAIKTLAEANGWTTLRYVGTGTVREWIGQSTGYSGTESIIIGIQTQTDTTNDIYNFIGMVATGFLTGSPFASQPGARLTGMCAHNNAITAYVCLSPQSLRICNKVGTPIFSHMYLGKFFPYMRPSEYPLPLYSGGQFNGTEVVRYSVQTRGAYFYGSNYTPQGASGGWRQGYLRRPDASWADTQNAPWSDAGYVGSNNSLFANDTNCLIPNGDEYDLLPVCMVSIENATLTGNNNYWGELEGIYGCTGYNSTSENVFQVGGTFVDQTGMTPKAAVTAILAAGGRAFAHLQDLHRTGFTNFIAMEFK